MPLDLLDHIYEMAYARRVELTFKAAFNLMLSDVALCPLLDYYALFCSMLDLPRQMFCSMLDLPRQLMMLFALL